MYIDNIFHIEHFASQNINVIVHNVLRSDK